VREHAFEGHRADPEELRETIDYGARRVANVPNSKAVPRVAGTRRGAKGAK